jgi:hypothetical protein
MIDIESQIFTKIVEALPDVYVAGMYEAVPSAFPAVYISEIDNSVWRNGISSSRQENYAAIEYEVNIYSNKTSGRKSECRQIAATVDSVMESLNFTRRTFTPVPNFADATIYRVVARYRAVVGQNEVLYRR